MTVALCYTRKLFYEELNCGPCVLPTTNLPHEREHYTEQLFLSFAGNSSNWTTFNQYIALEQEKLFFLLLVTYSSKKQLSKWRTHNADLL